MFRAQYDEEGQSVSCIASMKIVCPNEFLSLHNEDFARKEAMSVNNDQKKGNNASKKYMNSYQTTLEGHLLLVGGGDGEKLEI